MSNVSSCPRLATIEGEAAEPPQSGARLRIVPPPGLTSEQAIDEGRGIVEWLARRFARSDVDLNDLRQEGYVALLLAARTWRDDGGASFLTWARTRVYGEMRQLVRRERRRGLTARGARGEARALGFTIGHVSSLDEPAYGEDGRSLHDLIGTVAEQETAACDAQHAAKVRAAVAALPDRDRRIWALAVAGATTTAIGLEVGMVPSHVWWRMAKLCDEMQALIETGKGKPGRDNRDSRSKQITHDGVALSLPGWARRVGVSARVIRVRLELGWSVADALTIPQRPRGPNRNARSVRPPSAAPRVAAQLTAEAGAYDLPTL